MWIFTETGFVSAVKKPQDNGLVSIRARDIASLQPFVEATGQPIVHTPEGDYPYRIFVEQTDFADWVAKSALELDYSNFKSRMARHRDYKYLGALHEVWAAMSRTESAASRNFFDDEEAGDE
jgi:hypothetical protein